MVLDLACVVVEPELGGTRQLTWRSTWARVGCWNLPWRTWGGPTLGRGKSYQLESLPHIYPDSHPTGWTLAEIVPIAAQPGLKKAFVGPDEEVLEQLTGLEGRVPSGAPGVAQNKADAVLISVNRYLVYFRTRSRLGGLYLTVPIAAQTVHKKAFVGPE